MSTWLTTQMAEFHHSTKEEYRKKLAHCLNDEPGITTPAEYIAEYAPQYLRRNDDSVKPVDDHPINEAVLTLAKQAHMDVFYRCFPYTGQPYMLVTNNPGFPDPYSYLKLGEGRLYNQVTTADRGLDPTEMARIGGHYVVGWLSGTNLTALFESLIDSNDPLNLSSAPDYESYLQTRTANYWCYHAREQVLQGQDWGEITFDREIDPTKGFHSDFYYTTAYKFSTPGSDGIKSFTEKIEHDLQREIEHAQPKLVIAAGSTAWSQVYDAYASDLVPLQGSTEPADARKISDAKRGLYAVDTNGPPEYIISLKHPAVGGKYEDELIEKIKTERPFDADT